MKLLFTKRYNKKLCDDQWKKKNCDRPIDSDIKRYTKIRKLTAGQDEDYTTRCLLDYDYIKNYCRLIAVDLQR